MFNVLMGPGKKLSDAWNVCFKLLENTSRCICEADEDSGKSENQRGKPLGGIYYIAQNFMQTTLFDQK